MNTNYPAIPRNQESILENEIRITSAGKLTNSLHYAYELLSTKNLPSLTIKATGNALPKAISLAESLKRNYFGLYQNTSLGTTIIVDTYFSQGEGRTENQKERTVTYIEIFLSKDPLDISSPGYQAPISEEEFEQYKGLIDATRRKHFKRNGNPNRNKNSTRQPSEVQQIGNVSNGPIRRDVNNESQQGNRARNNRNLRRSRFSENRNRRGNYSRGRGGGRGARITQPPSQVAA